MATAAETGTAVRPFQVEIPEDKLADLRRRIDMNANSDRANSAALITSTSAAEDDRQTQRSRVYSA